MRWLLAAAGTIALVLAACGGDDDGEPTPAHTETPSTAPTSTPTPTLVAPGPSIRRDSSSNDLAFFANGLLYLDEGLDGELRRLPAGDECSQLGKFYSLSWSPDGARLLCTSGSGATVLMDDSGVAIGRATSYLFNCEWSPDAFRMLCLRGNDAPILTLVDGNLQQIADFPDSTSFGGVYRLDGLSYWSPRGDLFAYYAGASDEVIVTSAADLNQKQTLSGFRPLAWLDETSLIVAQGHWDTDFTTTTRYETSVWNVETGAFDRLPGLDYASATSGRHWQTWLLPSTRQAVVMVYRDEYPLGVAVIDIDTGVTTEIVGSKIGYPSDGIPPENVWLSKDGQYLWWEDVSTGITIQRASVATFAVEDIRHRNALAVSVSGDQQALAYLTVTQSSSDLIVEDFDGGGQATLASQTIGSGQGNIAYAWRPASP